MARSTRLATILVALTLTVAVGATRDSAPSRAEGVFEYVGTMKGQSILENGRFVFLYGPVDNSTPLVSDAGTYMVARDTFRATITYSTVAGNVGNAVRWTTVSWSGDTLTYALLDAAGHEAGRGRAVKRH
jgi:hypothetical protein